MGDRTSHPPGTFSWAELVTTDADSAKAFYTALLGWDYDDQPVGDDAVYSMAARDGKQVAALYTDAGQPPHWNCYVTVASADETTAKAKARGRQRGARAVRRHGRRADGVHRRPGRRDDLPVGAAPARSAPSSSTRRAR